MTNRTTAADGRQQTKQSIVENNVATTMHAKSRCNKFKLKSGLPSKIYNRAYKTSKRANMTFVNSPGCYNAIEYQQFSTQSDHKCNTAAHAINIILHRVQDKKKPFYFYDNLGRCVPILTILSLINCRRGWCKRFHFTSNLLPHYLVKFEC